MLEKVYHTYEVEADEALEEGVDKSRGDIDTSKPYQRRSRTILNEVRANLR